MPDRTSPRLIRLVDGLIHFRLVILGIVVVATVAAWPAAKQLTFDQSIESLYAADDPHLVAYLRSKRLFGGDEFAIVAYTDPGLFKPGSNQLSPASERHIRGLAARLNKVPGILPESTQHLAEALKFPFGRKHVRELVTGVLLGEDGKTTAIILRLAPEKTAVAPRSQTIAEIRQIAAAQKLPTFVVGEPVQVHDMFRYVEDDGRILFGYSLAILAVVLLMLFRTVRWVVLPLLVVVAAIFWTEAILVISRMQLSMVSSMLNSLVTIIGIATVTHVAVHFRTQRQKLNQLDALRVTLVELLPAVFWTCATTAVGFAALLSSEITPVRSFGVMMALGTLLVVPATAAVLPAGVLLGSSHEGARLAAKNTRLAIGLRAVSAWVDRRPGTLAIGILALIGLAGAGFFRLKIETDFSKNFRKSSSIVQSLDFVENQLGGAGSWEVNFPAPQELSNDYLGEVRALTETLRHVETEGTVGRLTKVVSLTDGLDLVPERILLRKLTLETRLQILSGFQQDFVATVYNAEHGRMRLPLRALERQPSEQKLQLIADVTKTANEKFPGAEAAGLYVLLAFLIQSLLRDQLVSFVLAAFGIVAMMTLAFRSWRIGLISLFPNLFPIVLVIGAMGWIGLPINIATAMIASVSMGLTVDSSIHYISAYRRARQHGADAFEAAQSTHAGVGRSLVFANVALIAGFCVLTQSHFIPLIYFGILVSVAMLGGLMGNLVMLPLLLRWADKGDKCL